MFIKVFFIEPFFSSDLIYIVSAITANILNVGIENALRIAATLAPASPPNALASGRPIIAKLDLITHCRTTPFCFSSGINNFTTNSPTAKKNIIAISLYKTTLKSISLKDLIE